MSQLYIYFTATSAEDALNYSTSQEPPIYDNDEVDKSIQRGIEPYVILGKLVAILLNTEWDEEMVEETNIYPPGAKPSVEDWISGLPEDSAWHEGLHCDQLTKTVLDALSSIPQFSSSKIVRFFRRVFKLGQQSVVLKWSQIEEWGGRVDQIELENTLRELSALANRAKSANQDLYVYYSI